MTPLADLARTFGKKLITAYADLGYPLLPMTQPLRRPIRWLYHRSPYLRHDSHFHWRPNLLLAMHHLLFREHPADFTIHGGQIKFRSQGSVMSVQGYYVGEIERHLVDFVVAQIRPGFVMLDVGAHHGAFTLIVAHELRARGWQGTIHSFEPDPGNFELLSHNVRANGLTDYVVLHQQAVSNKAGHEVLVGDAEENSGNTLASTGDFAINAGAAVRITHEVDVTTLDALLPVLPTVHFVKMDIQGAEPLALAGAERLFQRDRPVLAVEAVEGWPSSEETRAWLSQRGYHVHGVTRAGRPCPPGSAEAFVSWDWVALPD